MPIPSRPNTALSALVERFIVLAETNRDSAVDAMLRAGVPDRVIARVLCEPERRRPAHLAAE